MINIERPQFGLQFHQHNPDKCLHSRMFLLDMYNDQTPLVKMFPEDKQYRWVCLSFYMFLVNTIYTSLATDQSSSNTCHLDNCTRFLGQ